MSILTKMSTTTMMALKVFDLGKPSTKSMEISSQIRSRMGKGCNIPIGLRHLVLFFDIWCNQLHMIESIFHSHPPNMLFDPMVGMGKSEMSPQNGII